MKRRGLLLLPFLFRLLVCTPAKQEKCSHDEETAGDRSSRKRVASPEIIRYAHEEDGKPGGCQLMSNRSARETHRPATEERTGEVKEIRTRKHPEKTGIQ